MITDAQIHLWDAESPQRPWAEGTKPDIPEPMTAERAIAMMDEAGVARAVISPPGVYGFDPTHALEAVRRYPDRFAITSRYTLDDPKWREMLPTWLEQPGMIGIRFAVLGAAQERWTASGDLAAFWAECERLDIPLMVFAPNDLGAIEAAAMAHPGLTLTVDHVNLVNSTPDTVSERIDALNRLARLPNVSVKLGSLPLRSAGGAPYEDLMEPLRRVYGAFGAERLMWASDQTTTFARDRGSYAQNLQIMHDAYGHLPSAELDQILGGAVARLFRWPEAR